MKHRSISLSVTAMLVLLLAGVGVAHAANPPTIDSSTMVFQGTLTNHGDGTYSGVVPMVVEGGYDIYAKNGATAWFGNDPGTGPVWTSVSITNHDAWPTYDPDTSDWYQYSLEVKLDGGQYKWAVRNHAGATAEHPWYDEAYWGAGGEPARGVPMSGLIYRGTSYAEETDTGAYLPGTGTPEIAGGAANQGGGPHAWDMDWSWGSEMVPLEYPGFHVDVADQGSGVYKVTLTPAEGPVKNLDTDESFATIQAAIDDADTDDGDTISVAAGTYAENVVVYKSVTVVGDPGDAAAGPGPSAPVIDGSGSGTVVDITASNVMFRGFRVQNSGAGATDAGVRLYTVDSCSVNDNAVTGTANGIVLIFSSSNCVTANVVDANTYYGIATVAGTGNTFDLNTVTGNGLDAIALDNASMVGGSVDVGSTGNFIRANTLTSNRDGIFLGENCDNNQVTDGNQLSSIASIGISAWRSSGHTITDNAISGAATGIRLLGSSDNTVSGNFLTTNDVGAKVDASWQVGTWYQSENNTITDNDLSANTTFGVQCGTEQTALVDAYGNWWGSDDPADVRTAANGGSTVDYTPWLAVGTDTGDPGFQGDFSSLWVDDDSPQAGTTGRIQEGVDLVSGSTVHVAAGTYEEQVVIAKDLTLLGAGTTSIIKAPASMPACFTTSADHRPIVCIKDGATATVDSFTIDGAGRGNSNVRFEGVAFRNAGGALKNCTVKDIRNTPFSGAQHGVAVYAYNTDEIARTIHVLDNVITGFQKNAMALNAGDTTPLMVDVQRNVVTGAGATTVTAQNGIQVWADLGSGTVAHNTVSGIAYDNTLDSTKWVATSILNYYSDLDIESNDVSGAHMAVYNIDGAGRISGNDLTIEKVGVAAWGVCATDPLEAVPSPYGAEDMDQGGQLAALSAGLAATLSVDMSDNTVTFSGTDNTGTFGLEADAGYGADDIALTANRNTVTGFEVGIELWQCQSGCDVGVFTSVAAHGNCLSDNTYGMRSNADHLTVDGTSNWWGDATGPYHATKNAGGLGDDVSDYIDFEPWVTDGCGGSTTTGHWKNLRTVACDDLADSLVVAESGDTIEAVCSGLTPIPGGGTATVSDLTVDINGCVAGPGSPFLIVDADDVTVMGPGVIDGWTGSANSSDPAIRVLAGADNFILKGVEILRWADGVSLEGSVTSFKMGENFIHNNTSSALVVASGTSLGGVVTIEGNLFKDNGGPGVAHNGDGTLAATYNSWGDLAGPTGPLGDGVGSNVDYDPWTFAEFFLDMKPDDEAIVRRVLEDTSFDIELKADAARLYGLTFVFTYDTAKLTLGGTSFATPWAGRCSAIPGLPAGTVGYFCNLLNETIPDPEWDADGGTIATFHFTAFTGTPGNGPWTALFDISHLESDTSASAIGGQKVFVNNAGFNAPTIPQRDITDGDDGQIIIHRGANYTGFVDLQGRYSDELAVCSVWSQAAKAGAIELASGGSDSSGEYTTAHLPPNWLGIGSTYSLTIDRWLFLTTTPAAETSFRHSRLLDSFPTTALPTVYLLGGDATDDEVILINDLSCIGGDYGKTSGFTVCGTSGLSDVNEDGRVNVQDLSLCGGNLYKTFSPWTVP